MKAALERSAADAYATLQVGTAPRELQRIAALRQAKRAQFAAQFEKVVGAGGAGSCSRGRSGWDPETSRCSPTRPPLPAPPLQHLAKQEQGGDDYLADLPAHCLRETAGERVLVASGVVAILLQAASAWVALGLSLRLPVKNL